MTQRWAVFLSASIPQPGRKPFDQAIEKLNIREAVLALVGVCHEFNMDLVFGGHPAITPLVHHAVRSLRHASEERGQSEESWQVTIFQSLHFEKRFVPEVREFQKRNERLFASVPAIDVPPLPDESPDACQLRADQRNVAVMREEMIGRYRLPYKCAVFIGGMEGIVDEFVRFGKKWPQCPRFPITSTGGATRTGWPEVYNKPLFDALPEDHPRPPIPPLLHLVQDDRLTPEQRKLLHDDATSPGSLTYRTLFRKLFLPGEPRLVPGRKMLTE